MSGRRASYASRATFLQQNSRQQRSRGGEQPLDSPELHGLPVHQRVRLVEDAGQKGGDHAGHSEQEKYQGRNGEAQLIEEVGAFFGCDAGVQVIGDGKRLLAFAAADMTEVSRSGVVGATMPAGRRRRHGAHHPHNLGIG